jgi:hypothetical protein
MVLALAAGVWAEETEARMAEARVTGTVAVTKFS